MRATGWRLAAVSALLAAGPFAPAGASAAQAEPAPQAPAHEEPAPGGDAAPPAPAASAATPLKLRGPGGLNLSNPGTSSSSSWLGNGLLVALLAGGGFWAWKQRRNVAPARLPGAAAPLRVVGRLSLGGRGEAVVIEIEGRKMLLGVTAHTVQHLADLGDEPPAPALEMLEGRPPFADMLRAARAAKAVELRERGDEPLRAELDERPKTAAERRRAASAPAHEADEPAEPRPLERQVLGLRRKGQGQGS